MRHLTAIVQLTDRCNLGCRYCYVPEQGTDLALSTFKVLVDKMLAAVGDCGSISLVYHGGEPLLRGLDFFSEASAFIAQRGGRRRIDVSIQTNGTLLDDRFADFLVQQDIPCGISLDGPRQVHNANRVTCRAKQGSFDLAMRGINKLRERGRKVSALAVLSKVSLHQLRDIYDFFNEEGIDFKVNPVDLIGRSMAERQALEITPLDFGQALIELFDYWFNDAATHITISNLYDAMRSLAKGTYSECIFSNHACGGSYLGVAPNGDLYPCNRFSAYPEFRTGNILTDNLDDVFHSPCLVSFGQRSRELTECQGCEYRAFCNGGCTSRAYSHHCTVNARDFYCRSIKMMFGHIQHILQHEIANQEVMYAN